MKESLTIRIEKSYRETGRELVQYMKDARPGTLRHEALGDFLMLGNQKQILELTRNSFARKVTLPDEPATEVRLRVEEIKMVMIENRIRDRRENVPEYSSAFHKLQVLWKYYTDRLPTEKALEKEVLWDELWRGFNLDETT